MDTIIHIEIIITEEGLFTALAIVTEGTIMVPEAIIIGQPAHRPVKQHQKQNLLPIISNVNNKKQAGSQVLQIPLTEPKQQPIVHVPVDMVNKILT